MGEGRHRRGPILGPRRHRLLYPRPLVSQDDKQLLYRVSFAKAETRSQRSLLFTLITSIDDGPSNTSKYLQSKTLNGPCSGREGFIVDKHNKNNVGVGYPKFGVLISPTRGCKSIRGCRSTCRDLFYPVI